jgi:16S rRNA (adenine1518-N6/adenine1519-N6)-dimethyltransferase
MSENSLLYLFKKDSLVSTLKSHELLLNQNLGQNFLVNIKEREKLLSFIPFCDFILEIGSGLGHFTCFLLQKTKKLLGVEIDNGFFRLLTHSFRENSQSQFLHKDFLILKREDISFQPNLGKKIIVGNLPYNISSQILLRLKEFYDDFSHCFLLFQKEFVTQKLMIKTDKNLSFIFTALEPYYTLKLLTIVKAQHFFPAPKVDSAFIELIRKPKDDVFQTKNYLAFLETLFREPLRLLKNKFSCLEKDLTPIFKDLKISLEARIAHLSLFQIKALYQKLYLT